MCVLYRYKCVVVYFLELLLSILLSTAHGRVSPVPWYPHICSYIVRHTRTCCCCVMKCFLYSSLVILFLILLHFFLLFVSFFDVYLQFFSHMSIVGHGNTLVNNDRMCMWIYVHCKRYSILGWSFRDLNNIEMVPQRR